MDKELEQEIKEASEQFIAAEDKFAAMWFRSYFESRNRTTFPGIEGLETGKGGER